MARSNLYSNGRSGLLRSFWSPSESRKLFGG